MTRFNILLNEGVDLVLHALEHSLGGELFVRKIPSYKITDVATAIAPECEQTIVGIRPGEKLHEEMITKVDSLSTIETAKHYVIVPANPFISNEENVERYAEFHQAKRVPEGFSYTSDGNHDWLDIQAIRALVREHVDAEFEVPLNA